jgi:hypothetical protein
MATALIAGNMGRTPWGCPLGLVPSGPVPLDPLPERSGRLHARLRQREEGVPHRPGGLPHRAPQRRNPS